MQMADLFNYIENDTISRLHIGYRGNMSTMKEGYSNLDIWLGYDAANQRRYIIFGKTNLRTKKVKWYVGSMEVPKEKSEDGIPSEELKKLCEASLTRKNAVLPNNIEGRLEKLAKQPKSLF